MREVTYFGASKSERLAGFEPARKLWKSFMLTINIINAEQVENKAKLVFTADPRPAIFNQFK